MSKVYESCVIFTHHKNDPVTEQNLQSFRDCNPGVPIIPVSCHFDSKIPGSIDLTGYEDIWRLYPTRQSLWLSTDVWFFRWFQKYRQIEAKRYFIIEWDTFTLCSLEHFYKDVWDADIAGASIRKPGERWDWWKHLDFEQNQGMKVLPKGSTVEVPLASMALGIVPMCGVMVSHTFAETLVNTPYYIYGMSELRLATLANIYGFEIAIIPNSHFLGFGKVRPENIKGPTIYHQVKYLVER